jgi:hypothetical protein
MHIQKLSVLVGVFLVTFVSVVRAGEWQNSWSSEKGAASQRCAKTFDDYQLQAVCMDNERDGYNKMQGNFGLPSSVEHKAKMRCANTFNDLQLQAVCMQNKKDGYDKMQNY